MIRLKDEAGNSEIEKYIYMIEHVKCINNNFHTGNGDSMTNNNRIERKEECTQTEWEDKKKNNIRTINKVKLETKRYGSFACTTQLWYDFGYKTKTIKREEKTAKKRKQCDRSNGKKNEKKKNNKKREMLEEIIINCIVVTTANINCYFNLTFWFRFSIRPFDLFRFLHVKISFFFRLSIFFPFFFFGKTKKWNFSQMFNFESIACTVGSLHEN